MANQVLHGVLENLAERYIPKGKHKLLHVDSRETWIDLMEGLLEKGLISRKMSILSKCAVGWEALLTQKISILN
jgi:hypothetical protein